MKYNFEKTSNVQGELALTIEKEDIEPRVAKALKELRTKAQMPGFRRGQVPLSIITKRFGMDVKQEEVQKLIGEKLYEYIRQEDLNILGEPMGSDRQKPIDFAADELEFDFTVALAPEFDATLTAADTIPYYNIEVTDDMVNQDISSFASRNGHHESADTYATGDMVKGHLAELDEQGNIKPDGLQKEDAVILPTYMKNDEQKAKFDGLQAGTVVTINPFTAYDGSEVELATLLGIDKELAKDVKSDFSFQVTEISRWTPSELNQELFDSVLGEGKAANEEEFRAAVRQLIEQQFAQNTRMRFVTDVRDYLIRRIGTLEWPEQLMKRLLQANADSKAKAKTDEELDKEVSDMLPSLEWHLIQEQLAKQTGVKVERDDLLAEARTQTRMQFAQFGYGNAPDDLVDRYANDMLRNQEQAQQLQQRALDTKLGEALTTVVTLDKKSISLADFNKLYE